MVRSQEEEVVTIQHCDSKLLNLINILKLSPEQRTVEQTNLIKPFILKNNKLYRLCKDKEGAEKELWVVPICMRKSIVMKNHDLAGHGAVDRTVTKIQENYYFPKMRRYLRYHITCCPDSGVPTVQDSTEKETRRNTSNHTEEEAVSNFK